MKLLYIIFVLLLSSEPFWAQVENSNPDLQGDSSTVTMVSESILDSLSGIDTTIIISDESDKAEATVPASHNKLIVNVDTAKSSSENDTLLTPLERLQKPAIEALKQISFITILNILFFLFLGVVLVKLTDKFSLGKNFIYHNSIKLFVKIIIWILIVYIILHFLLEEPNDIVIYIILAVAIIFGVSTISYFKNLVGGFYLSIKVPFQVGDYISTSNIEGAVKQINWRDTVIETTEGSVVIIPNSSFIEQPFENINKGVAEQMISVELLFPTIEKPEFIKEIVLEAALSSPYNFTAKPPKVFLMQDDLLNNVYKFELQVYIKDGKFENEFIDSLNMILSKYIFGNINLEERSLNS